MDELKLRYPHGLEPVYTNRLMIWHSETEVVVDAFVVTQGQPETSIRARLVMSPETAKSLWSALGQNIAQYERQYGIVHVPGDMTLANNLFGDEED